MNDKKFCLLCSISQEPYIKWLWFMVQMCKMIISPGGFFNFKILIFQVVGTERVKNDPKWPVCGTLYFRNHISYGLHLWYTCVYKRIISPGIFFIFLKKFNFRIIREWDGGGKRTNNGPKWQKILSVSLCISGTLHHMILIFGTHGVKWWYFQQIFSFFKILIFWYFWG